MSLSNQQKEGYRILWSEDNILRQSQLHTCIQISTQEDGEVPVG